ncbi:ATP-binding protein, partial [Methylobacterium jeotgali]|uniref:ATP-binding protein n=1 Tax=Methylobacterium jeotgali TaxID=381630 RepID=UPI0024B4A74B
MTRPSEGEGGDPVLDALAPWLDGRTASPVLLAVSGGPDSTALMHAAARLAPAGSIHVATVDHRLRPGSAAEAEAVAAKAAR